MDRLEDDCGPRAGYDLLSSAPGLSRRAGLENPRKWNIPFGYWVTEGRGILEGGGGDARSPVGNRDAFLSLRGCDRFP